jgi:hypothetical protein
MSRFKKILLSFSVIVVASMLLSCRSVARYTADKVYPDLETYYDTEAPPTPMSIPASSSITTVIGGRGEGLSCSIPPLLQLAMFDRAEGDATISLQFRQACVYHDYCYRHGHATYGYTRNDCDYALQRFAYRTCRLINNRDAQDCMSRARRVLLGVTLGGGKAFSSHAASTYFEFDPMPEKADDYVIVRWLRAGNGAAMGPHGLNGRFLVMHYKRGTVSINPANFDPSAPASTAVPQLFPFRYIATPPFVLHDGKEDRLWAVARNNFRDTGIKVVEYWPVVNGERTYGIGQLKEYAPDLDASVFWFGRERVGELRYWSNTIGFGMANKGDSRQSNPRLHARYRTLQHAPVEGSFFTPGCIDTAVLKRGGPQASTADDDGDGYEGQVHAYFVHTGSAPCRRPGSLTLAASQAHEPLSVMRLDNGRDVLVSMQREDDSVQLSLFDLAQAKGTTPLQPAVIGLSPQFDASWLTIPPQVVTDVDGRPSFLFLSRYRHWIPGSEAQVAQFEFRYLKLASAGDGAPHLVTAGNGSCTINLSGQLALVRKAILGENIARSFPQEAKESKEKSMARAQKIEQAILGDLNERWANAQVIPGRFLWRADGREDGPLDVAVFFRGYPQYAFLAQGTQAGTAGFRIVAPENYVSCDQPAAAGSGQR